MHERYGWFPEKFLPLWCFQYHDVSRSGESWFRHINFPYLAIEMVLEGVMEFKEGCRSVPVLPGELYIIPPGSIINASMVDSSTTVRTLTLLFDGGILRALTGHLGLTGSCAVHPDNPDKIIGKIRRIGALLKRQQEGDLLDNQLCSYALLLEIAALVVDYGNGIQDLVHAFLRNPGRRGNVADLARQASCSAATLHKYFLQNFGKAPGVWMREHRLNYAAKLLLSKKLLIKEVAVQCGFDNVQSFSHAFKRYFGFAPDEFVRRTEKG